jgi:Ca2+-binding EF-hand superfamily protein
MVSAIGGASASLNYASIKQTQQSPQERFSVSDVDGSGELSLQEYSDSFVPSHVSDVEGSFTQIDYDGNGSLSYEELGQFAQENNLGGGQQAGGPPPGGGPPPSGGASSSEEASVLEELLAEAAEESEDLLALLDSDEDGTISQSELKTGTDQLISSFLNSLLSVQEEATA